MATIALVMIVKNEEKILEKCVESVKNIVNEFIICDTGSTDSTPEIIKKYGEPHPLVFTNYVDTKNEALKLATSDYILLMDADEILISGSDVLKEHAGGGTECVNAKIIEETVNGISNTYFRARLWKNNGKWSFQGPNVHETLVGEGYVINDHRILVKHDHTHRTRESYLERFTEYVKILEDYLKKHPNDARTTFYLGRTNKDLGNWLDAIMYYRQYLDLNTTFLNERWQAAIDIGYSWKSQGEYDQCLEACDLAEKIDSRRAETFVLKGEIFFALQNWDEAIVWYEKAASLPIPTDVLLFMNPRAHFEIPTDQLVLCWDKKKEYRKATELTKKLLDRNTGQPDQRIVNNLNWLNKQKNKIIFFALGNTPEPIWGGMMDEVGLGGLEQTYLCLPEAMTVRGHTCFVFCRTKEDHVHNGVYFVQYEKLVTEYKDWHPDIIIASRWWDAFYLFPGSKKIQWGQDAHYSSPEHSDALQVIDAFIVSSKWHREYTAERFGLGLDAKKIHIIPLSIDGDLFKDKNIKRNPKKVLYASNPDRGLTVLQDMWQEISSKVEGIQLAIAYGFEGLRTWGNDPAWIQKINDDEKRLIDWAKKVGNVSITGRIKKSDLAKEMMESSLVLYPNNFWETYCLVAEETQAAGCPMITTKLGALTTTLNSNSNILIDDNPFSDSYKRKFIDATVDLMTNPDKLKEYSDKCISHFKQQPTWEQVAAQWEQIIYNL